MKMQAESGRWFYELRDTKGCGGHQKLGRGLGWMPASEPQKEPSLTTPWSWTSSLQTVRPHISAIKTALSRVLRPVGLRKVTQGSGHLEGGGRQGQDPGRHNFREPFTNCRVVGL